MAHEIETMAYAGETPWHGLGNKVNPMQTVEEWQVTAGLNWQVSKRPVLFAGQCLPGANNGLHTFKDKFVLTRDSDERAFSVVSGRYKPVQPKEILEFFRTLVDNFGMTIETAGSLKDGQRIWALAKTGNAHEVMGVDRVDGYLLLATSYDLTFSTLAQFTSVRVVCNNTLQQSFAQHSGRVSIPHFRDFNMDQVKTELGVGHAQWQSFTAALDAIAKIKLDFIKAKEVLGQAFSVDLGAELNRGDNKVKIGHINNVIDLFSGKAIGSDIAGQTGWGLVNAATEYMDQRKRAHNAGNRIDSAWFGEGAVLTQRVFNEVLALAA